MNSEYSQDPSLGGRTFVDVHKQAPRVLNQLHQVLFQGQSLFVSQFFFPSTLVVFKWPEIGPVLFPAFNKRVNYRGLSVSS